MVVEVEDKEGHGTLLTARERECIFQGNEDYSRFTSFSVALCGVTPLGYTCWCAFDKDCWAWARPRVAAPLAAAAPHAAVPCAVDP